MRSTGEYIGTHRTTDGELIVSFVIDESRKTLAELEKLEEQKVTIDVQKFYDKRSNQANAYLWVLCDKIAEILHIPGDYDMVCILPVGKAKGDPVSPKKKPFEERAWFNQFGK